MKLDLDREERWYVAVIVGVLLGCVLLAALDIVYGDHRPCLRQECTPTMQTIVTSKGDVVIVPTTTCFCVEYGPEPDASAR